MKPVKPDLSYAEQILAYKREMEEHHVSFDGCAGHKIRKRFKSGWILKHV